MDSIILKMGRGKKNTVEVIYVDGINRVPCFYFHDNLNGIYGMFYTEAIRHSDKIKAYITNILQSPNNYIPITELGFNSLKTQ